MLTQIILNLQINTINELHLTSNRINIGRFPFINIVSSNFISRDWNDVNIESVIQITIFLSIFFL